jgi:hypothetical protein
MLYSFQKYFQLCDDGDAIGLKATLDSLDVQQFNIQYPLPCHWNDSRDPLHLVIDAGSLDCVELLVEKIEKSLAEPKWSRNVNWWGKYSLIVCR